MIVVGVVYAARYAGFCCGEKVQMLLPLLTISALKSNANNPFCDEHLQ